MVYVMEERKFKWYGLCVEIDSGSNFIVLKELQTVSILFCLLIVLFNKYY